VLASGSACVGFLVLWCLSAICHYDLVLASVMLVGFGTAGGAFGVIVSAGGVVRNYDPCLVLALLHI